MKGYVYLDNDKNLNIRLKDYIEIEDPLFWDRNAHIIDTVWKFDSESYENMEDILSSFRRLELSSRQVTDFCKSIKFDLQSFLLSRNKT